MTGPVLSSSGDEDADGEDGHPAPPPHTAWRMEVDFPTLTSLFVPPSTPSLASFTSSSSISLSFDLPLMGALDCQVRESKLFPSSLRTKYPQLVAQYGRCNQGQVRLLLNLHADSPTSFSATFTRTNSSSSSTTLFLDHSAARGHYLVYSKNGQAHAHPTQHQHLGCHNHRTLPRRSAAAASYKTTTSAAARLFSGVTLRLAIATNREYSLFAGDTPALVLNSVAAVVSRVNGIYMRELGVYFQLADDTDSLFCTLGKSKNCATLPNENGPKIIDSAFSFFESRGMPDKAYDVGHVLTTGSGGMASLAVMCTAFKAQGTTGMRTPVGDAFSVDYVAHELGHQLNGMHTFQDCGATTGDDGTDSVRITPETAVEPGSGSTIMAYAGVCKTTNLQQHSDPYFHSVNVQMMQEFIQHQLVQDATCGLARLPYVKQVKIAPTTTTTTTTSTKKVSSVEEECKVPVGNAFMLSARATTDGSLTHLSRQLQQHQQHFQWEEIDVGVQSLANAKLARFRSWKPRLVGQRFLPNLYYQSFGLHLQAPYDSFERLPATPRAMRFRFSVRTRYDSLADDAQEDDELLGDFAFRDYTVRVVSALVPLKFTAATQQALRKRISANKPFTFMWTKPDKKKKTAGGTSHVEILMAVNPMQLVSIDLYDSETHLVDLAWVSLGVVKNTGSAKLTAPILGDGGNVPVSFMIRTPLANRFCAPFDFVAGGELVAPAVAPTRRPTQPTRKPTVAPSKKPTRGTSAPTKRQIIRVLLANNKPVVQQLLHVCQDDVECATNNMVTAPPACRESTRVARYTFSAPSTGTYLFTTENAKTTCRDTTLYALEEDACNDDIATNNPRSQLHLRLLQGNTATLFVGSFGDECSKKSTVSLKAAYVSTDYSSASPTTFPTLAPTSGTPSLTLPANEGIPQTLSTCVVPGKWCNYDAYGSPCKTSTRVVGYRFTAPATGQYVFSTSPGGASGGGGGGGSIGVATACHNATLYAVQFDVCAITTTTGPKTSSSSSLQGAELTLPMQANELVELFVGSFGNVCQDGSTVMLGVRAVTRSPTAKKRQ